ncbi:DNA cytosine methyltransferase [Novosphingobium sp. MW5]|nr:DNA cytosine methyltransferase [Novosphingobium sp. MW5]
MPSKYGVIDLFAGPGGLGEGFASLVENSSSPYHIGISVEKEASAHSTLRLRAFLREFIRRHGNLPFEYIEFHAGARSEPDWNSVDAAAWEAACREARCLELGTPEAAEEIDAAIDRLRSGHAETVLIGGPPCQAYSLVGRARSRGKKDYRPEDDARHFLFREYIRVLDRLRPAVFVMENVKGMLSSTVQSRQVFGMLMEDLSSLGGKGRARYELRAIRIEDGRIRLREARRPADFIVRAEDVGVPQRRHRVIIVGVRSDLAGRADRAEVLLPSQPRVTVGDAIGTLAALRSGLSQKGSDSPEAWKRAVRDAAQRLRSLGPLTQKPAEFEGRLQDVIRKLDHGPVPPRSSRVLPEGYGSSNHPLRQWLENDELMAVAQHDSRGHMEPDLSRYLFAAVFGEVMGRSPKASEFPASLAPDHRNWDTGKFADRFRVQLADEPSTTVTSHISKDGHYFIHPDPAQCRSLTVREAARLQTFPDDYLFLGNRTQQYVQVGNAVPPYLARQIAQLLLRLLGSGAPEAALAGESEAGLLVS